MPDCLGVTPLPYVAGMAAQICQLWKMLAITKACFIRTTDCEHVEAVQEIVARLICLRDVYLGETTGWYSVEDVQTLLESQLSVLYRAMHGMLIGGCAPSGHVLQLVQAPATFFCKRCTTDRLLCY